MKRSLRSLALAAVLALAAATTATAAPPGNATGNFTPVSQTLTVTTVDGYTFVHEITTHAWSGTLDGTSVIDVHFVVSPSGTLTYVGLGTFTGTTPCGSGTVRFFTAGSGPVPGPITGIYDAITGSTPFHAHLNIVLFLTAAQNAVGTYSGQFHCG
jgi:hypothetical protein